MNELVIGHGTLNKDKNAALWRALLRLGTERMGCDKVTLFEDEASSGVDEQPYGPDMGALGAENRAIASIKSGLAKGLDVRYGIGGESWMQITRGFSVDTATIVIVERQTAWLPESRDAYRLVALATSVGVPIPLEHMVTAFDRGVRTTTAGSCFAAANGVNGKNWHRAVTHDSLDRLPLLEDAYFAALVQVW